jgi:membrane fusion protein, heavy metal efflux system
VNRKFPFGARAAAASLVLLAGCNNNRESVQEANRGAPPQAEVIHESDVSVFRVDHPERFPLTTAAASSITPELLVTGTINPDISRNLPVISLASGRIVDVRVRLGDTVTKGQVLMRVQSPDIAQADSDYQQAVADEQLSKSQLDRSKVLYDKGAIAQKDLEVAEDTDKKAVVTVQTTLQKLKLLGGDPAHPQPIIDIRAPTSGVITEQQVTNAAGTQGLASPNAFTISDLSHVWVLCDVFENDLHYVRLGEFADVRLNAYPNRVFPGRISNIGHIIDPNIRAAKVRLELNNPGLMRFGMFVTATFHGETQERVAVVPAAAVLHLHDQNWVYVPAPDNQFRRVSVVTGNMLPGNLQIIKSGINPGDEVVERALVLENAVEQ